MIDNSEQIDKNVTDVEYDSKDNSILFKCAILNDLFLTNANKIETESEECETCGSHGIKSTEIVCECEMTHKVVLDVW
jgi:hypothetical protein